MATRRRSGSLRRGSDEVSRFVYGESTMDELKQYLESPLGKAGLVGALAIVVFVVAHFSGRMWATLFGPPAVNREKGLKEVMAEYPPPPGKPGPRQLTISGIPVRLRLVVIAPVGKARPLDKEEIELQLNTVVRGIKEIIERDKPRVRFWPPQLSSEGFAPSFHRLTETPDAPDDPSCWVVVGGPAMAAGRPILLGLACVAQEPNEIGKIVLASEDWAEMVRVITTNA